MLHSGPGWTSYVCGVVAGTCDVVAGTCDVVARTCDVVAGTCDVVAGTCDVVAGMCDVVASSGQDCGFCVAVTASRPGQDADTARRTQHTTPRWTGGSGGAGQNTGCSPSLQTSQTNER